MREEQLATGEVPNYRIFENGTCEYYFSPLVSAYVSDALAIFDPLSRWFDPSVTPGTGYPVPGGLSFAHGAALIRSVGERGLLAGIDVTEIYPDRDVRGLTALVTLRLLVHAMGFAARGAGREDCVLPAAWC